MKTLLNRRFVRAASALVLGACGVAIAQPTGTSPLTAPPNGPKSADATWHALVGATVHVKPGQTFTEGAVVIRDGRIVTVIDTHNKDWAPPAGARVWDCSGLHVYAGFIDAYVEVEAPAPDPKAPGVHWNTQVTPQRSALDGTGVDDRTAESMRKLGFAAAAIAPRGGVFRGTGAVVSLGKPPSESGLDRPPVYLDRAYHAIGLGRGGFGGGGGGGGYPGSQMGVIAVIRQTLNDVQWQTLVHEVTMHPEPSALDALGRTNDATAETLLFDTGEELESLRAAKIVREFGEGGKAYRGVILGSGTEFRRLDTIAADKLPLIVPLNFPRNPDVASIGKAEGVELRELMTWEQAPTNPRRLEAAGLTVALTTHRLRDRGQFADNLRKAIKHGLAPDAALAMVTTRPASILGVGGQLGTVEPGKVANLVVADGDLFSVPGFMALASAEPAPAAAPADAPDGAQNGHDAQNGDDPKKDDAKDEKKSAKVRDVWIDGARYEIAPAPVKEAVGTWAIIEGDGKPFDPEAPGTPRLYIDDKNAITVKVGDKKAKAANVKVEKSRVSYTYDDSAFGTEGVVIDQATLDGDEMIGVSQMADGAFHRWKAKRVSADAKIPDEKPKADAAKPDPAKAEGDAAAKPEADAAGNERGGRGPRGDRAGQPAGDKPAAEKPKLPEEKERAAIAAIPEKYGYPFGPYALPALPAKERIAIINATVWTSGPAGVIENGAVVFADGAIAYVGPMANLPRLDGSHRTIDAAGKHVTPGLIDCHSHTGISGGVNEGTQACTSEVRIEDVTNPDAINWYRQLAGGITTVNNLHGSANPIGGQNCVNKARWGVLHPDDMHFEGAKPGIKFALGENVKQSNWDAAERTRYPQTRMGVESIIRDRFVAAKEYAAARSGGSLEAAAVRRDLELDALAEILAGDRLVHCHSYRQDEILMLARLAQEFGFTIGTFQHNLEGYKVADAVRDSALGASLFSDWWNYKVEVQDAIPQAGPIMWEVGNVVSYNSDSDELARRMNVEAGKAVKYGGLKPEEALKFVTINPAIQLAVDGRVGSLEAGKDADVAIWSGPPLSSLSRCEATFVDGRELFSLEQDKKHRATIAGERRRLIQKLLADSAGGRPEGRPEGGRDGEAGPPGGRRRPTDDLDPRADYYRAQLREHYLDMMRRGLDPETHKCGDCGMSVLEVMGVR
ncbi:MAG: amidohydrolase family protein [Phycisphaerales bacterium]